MNVGEQPVRSVPGCPQSGWLWLRCTDLREDEGLTFGEYEDCEFCGHEQIRFVHELKHPDWTAVVRVGCICAAHYTRLSLDDLGTRERHVRNRSERRRRFPAHRSWRFSANGNLWINYRGVHVVALCSSKGYRLIIDGEKGKRWFADLREAKLRAFDIISKREELSRK